MIGHAAIGAEGREVVVDVLSVVDGDGFIGRVRGEVREFRIWGIDAPEKGQAFGLQARNMLRVLIGGQSVRCRPKAWDKYGRLVCTVRLLHWPDVGRTMIDQGGAWWYRDYAPEKRAYKAAEKTAKQLRRGLWQHNAPTPPWDWRGRRVKRGVRQRRRRPH